MINNYLKVAWRNILKYRLFSFINILGLSIAIPSALMALIQIVNYYEYDRFHREPERLVRIITDTRSTNGDITEYASSPVPLGAYVNENLAGIDHASTIVREGGWVLSNGLKTKNIQATYADQAFFGLFNFPLEKGTYPYEPNTVLLTHETAQWFFGDADPVGSVLEHPKYGNFKVSGVLKPFNKQKTQFRTDVFVPLAGYLASGGNAVNWAGLNAHTFARLGKGRAARDINRQLAKTSAEINRMIGRKATGTLKFKAQPFTEISPAATILENDPYVQDIRSIYINFAFQLIIIFLASLNYINLTLARSMNRGREVGVRKVAGATKMQLVLQFLTESVLISYIALAIGLLLLWVIKNYIHLSWLTWEIDHPGYLIAVFFLFNFLLGLAAGASPSLILSSYQPVNVLKGSVSPASFGKIGFRKSLILVQFVIAIIYIFFIGHAFHQIDYMANDNENYRRNDILNIGLQGNRSKLLADIGAIKEVQHVGFTSLSFGNAPTQATLRNPDSETPHNAYYYAADGAFIENMGLRLVAGQNLAASHSESPSPMIVVNRRAVEKLGLGHEQEAIGKLVMLNDTVEATVAGVVGNFCHYDYEAKIEPVVFQYKPALFRVMCVQTTAGGNRSRIESEVGAIWKKHNPYLEMHASWLDTDMYERYFPRGDMQLMWVESIAIFTIAILGLIGILTYSLEKRTKEIGIRKVAGATTFEIVRLMSADFLRLLAIATAVAVPLGIGVAYYMNTYMVFNNGIGYRSMSLLLALVIGVSLAAVGYFSRKAAQTNPASTLKAE